MEAEFSKSSEASLDLAMKMPKVIGKYLLNGMTELKPRRNTTENSNRLSANGCETNAINLNNIKRRTRTKSIVGDHCKLKSTIKVSI